MVRKLKITEMQRLSPQDFRKATKAPISLVLDNVRSLHNVGSLFRTADALRVSDLYLCGITGVPPHPELHKTALGAEEVVAWHYSQNTLSAVQELKSQGVYLIALEQAEGSVNITHLSDLKLSEYHHIALVLGNEVEGVSQDILDICDSTLEIPQFGTKHSMNVSVAGGIALWEIWKDLFTGCRFAQQI